MAKDLEFISGEFNAYEIPKDLQYLCKYFCTPLQISFLKYFLVFGDRKNFVPHTGIFCEERTLQAMKRKFLFLTRAHSEAKSSFSEESLVVLDLIESGKLNLTKALKSGKIDIPPEFLS